MTLSIIMTFFCLICGGWPSLLCTIPAFVMASAVSAKKFCFYHAMLSIAELHVYLQYASLHSKISWGWYPV